MKILRKILIIIIVTIMTVTLTSNAQINILASPSLNTNNRSIANIAVVLPNFYNPFGALIKQGLEDIQKKNENKVKFTFFDGKDNIAIQNEILDNLLNSKFNLLIVQLVNTKENTVEDVIYKANQKKVPLILSNVNPLVASKFSEYANKVAFVTEDFKQAAMLQGKIIIDAWNADKKI